VSYEIAEQSADRLVVRRYWSGRGEGLHMFVSGIVFLFAAVCFASSGRISTTPLLVSIMFVGVAPIAGVFFLWLSPRQRRRVEEGLYIFDKRRGVFELRHRNERSTTVAESYPIDQVQSAIADDIGSEGYARRLVIVLRERRAAALYNWMSFIPGDTERASKAINDFLGLD
jgi:hypothetical protein